LTPTDLRVRMSQPSQVKRSRMNSDGVGSG
jgi:hypothetical protein